MLYQQFRNQVKNGTIIFLEPRGISKLIAILSRGTVSHCGTALWFSDATDKQRLMLIEGFVGGCRLVNLSSYANRKMIAVEPNWVWEEVESYALDKTGVVHYGYFDYLWIWLRELLLNSPLKRLAKYVPDSPGEVCSQVVADLMIKSKRFELESSLMSPQAVLDHLRAYKCNEFST